MLDRDLVGFRALSYLPMAHIAERMSSHYLGILGGLEVTTCPDAGLLSQVPARRCGRRRSSACRACGRSSTAA